MNFLGKDEANSASPHLTKDIKEFSEKIKNSDFTPLYELTPEQARKFLADLQKESNHNIEADVEDSILMTPEEDNVDIRIIRPKGNNEKLPVILYLHGGGWVMGDKETHDYLIKRLSICSDAAVVFPMYEPSPEAHYPKAIEQCYSVLEYIWEHPDEFNVNTNKIVVAGDSAGGAIATAIAMKAAAQDGPKIDCQILLYPVTSAKMDTASYTEFKDGPWLTKKAMEWFWDTYAPEKERRKEKYASPLEAQIEDLKDLPPALVITNQNDVLRDEGELYAQKLTDAGVKVVSIRLNGTIHDCMMLNAINLDTTVQAAYSLCCEVLKEIFSN